MGTVTFVGSTELTMGFGAEFCQSISVQVQQLCQYSLSNIQKRRTIQRKVLSGRETAVGGGQNTQAAARERHLDR